MDEHVGGSSTSWRARAAKQLRGWARGSAREGGACRPAAVLDRARDPHQITVASPIPPFCFLQNTPKS